MFFDFLAPLAAGTRCAPKHVHAVQSARPPHPPSLRAQAASAGAPPSSPRAPAYVTEARAAELFLEAARACRSSDVQRARVVFKPFRATLYSFRIRRGGAASVKFHVAFRQASETVLAQAARLMLTRRRRDRRVLPRAEYDAFVRALPPSDFELPGARRGHQLSVAGPGKHHSLEESFRRVNAEYFRAQIEQPQLCWSPARARRILGSYQERHDRVIISRAFDTPRVPLFVLDYLLYHELLHKFLGIGRRDSGKRLLHGKDFRKLEKHFRYFKEAQAFLKRM